MTEQRYITLWRKRDNPLDWDFYVSEDMLEVGSVVRNLVDQGVKKYTTYPIDDRAIDFSSTDGER